MRIILKVTKRKMQKQNKPAKQQQYEIRTNIERAVGNNLEVVGDKAHKIIKSF